MPSSTRRPPVLAGHGLKTMARDRTIEASRPLKLGRGERHAAAATGAAWVSGAAGILARHESRGTTAADYA